MAIFIFRKLTLKFQSMFIITWKIIIKLPKLLCGRLFEQHIPTFLYELCIGKTISCCWIFLYWVIYPVQKQYIFLLFSIISFYFINSMVYWLHQLKNGCFKHLKESAKVTKIYFFYFNMNIAPYSHTDVVYRTPKVHSNISFADISIYV